MEGKWRSCLFNRRGNEIQVGLIYVIYLLLSSKRVLSPADIHRLNYVCPPGLVHYSPGLVLVRSPDYLRLKVKGKKSSKG